jgi:hypothetical protein
VIDGRTTTLQACDTRRLRNDIVLHLIQVRGWSRRARLALAALAIFLMLNAVTPFITPDPPWLANLPLVVAIMAFLLAFGLSHMRAERARAAEMSVPKPGRDHPTDGGGASALVDLTTCAAAVIQVISRDRLGAPP